jgi:O-methyltransferase domain/Dimerisation domain
MLTETESARHGSTGEEGGAESRGAPGHDPHQLPPPVQLLQLMNGYWITQSIAVAAELRIADEIDAAGTATADELAQATGTHAPSLKRLLRALAMIGVLEEQPVQRFGLTPVGAFLRQDVPGSLRALARMRGSDWQWRSWRDLGHSIRTGETALEHVYGKPLFEYFATDSPEDGAVFNEAMTSHASQMHTAVAAAYDFPPAGTVVDVGAGHGTLVAAILHAHPGLEAIVFDLPNVVPGARDWLGQQGQAARCEFVAGDFFDEVPAGGDVYALSHIVHDWDDEKAIRLLKTCRAAMPADARLAVCEMVVPTGPEPHFSKLLDLEMLVNTGGQERTREEYERLYAAAGFELTRVVPTPTPVSVIEGRPV